MITTIRDHGVTRQTTALKGACPARKTQDHPGRRRLTNRLRARQDLVISRSDDDDPGDHEGVNKDVRRPREPTGVT
jgi:hypothetical protein